MRKERCIKCERGESASGLILWLVAACIAYYSAIGIYDFIQTVKHDRQQHQKL